MPQAPLQQRHECGLELAVAGGDSSEVLEVRERVLDDMAGLVRPLVVGRRIDPVRAGGDHHVDALLGQIVSQWAAIVSLVGNETADVSGAALKERVQLIHFSGIPGCQGDLRRLS